MAYDIPTRFHNVWSRHLREMCRTNFWRKKERKKKKKNNKNNNKKRSKHNMYPKLRLGDIITVFQSKYTTVFVLLDISESK